jgi:hypothetical protein
MASQEFQGEEPQASPSTDVDTSTHGPRHSLQNIHRILALGRVA